MKRKCLTAAVLLLALALALGAAALADDGYTLKNGGSDRSGAKTISMGVTYAGYFGEGNSQDQWYSFMTPAAPGFTTFTVKNLTTGNRWVEFFLTSAIGEIKSDHSHGAGGGSYSVRLDPNTPYYIRVHSRVMPNDYFKICVTFTLDAVGDTFSDAADITLGKKVTGTMDGDLDRDVYRFTPPEDQEYLITGTNISVSWLDWSLGRPDEQSQAIGSTGTNGRFERTVSLMGGKTCYMTVKNRGFNTGSYTLSVEKSTIDLSGFRIDLDSDTVPYTGREAAPKVTVTDKAGRALKQGEDYTVTFSDNIRVGTASVTVRGKGGYSGTLKGTFHVKYDMSGAEITLAKDRYTYTGKALAPKVKSVTVAGKTIKEGTGFTVAYEDDRDVGTGKVILTGTENCMGRAEKTFKITKAPLGTVKLTDDEIAYTGKPVAPKVTVKNKAGDKLTQGVDYTLTFKNNKAVGNAKVIVKGKGNYTGQAEAGFKIKYDLREAAVTLNGYSFVSGGKKIRPQVLKVKVRGKTVPASSYSVTYENNTDVGTGTVRLTGKKKAMGSAEETFEIRPGRPGSVSVKALGLQFSGLMSEPRRVKVTWSRPASGADRYEIRYSTHKDGTDARTVTADGKTAELRGLKAKTVYYVWVRAVKNGVESDWAAVKKVTTK